MYRISVLLLVCMFSPLASAQKVLRFDRADLTVLGVTIGTTSRDQVEQHLGSAPVFKLRGNEDADNAVCYRSVVQSDDTVLVFHFGALGAWINVTEISISQGKPAYLRGAICPPNEDISHELRFLRGMHLGISSADVKKKLGRPSHATKTKLLYYVSHCCRSQEHSCEIVDSVEARFSSSDELSYATFYHFIDK